MNKMRILAAVAVLAAMVGISKAGDVVMGRGLWFQHPAIFPATQTIGAGGIIAADACGGTKRITSGSNVTTDTTNTFAAPSALNSGCTMRVLNVGSNNITLDSNTNFNLPGSVASMALQPGGSVTVTSLGATAGWARNGTWTPY